MILPTRDPFVAPHGSLSLRFAHLAPLLTLSASASSAPGERTFSAFLEDYHIRTDEAERGWKGELQVDLHPSFVWGMALRGVMSRNDADNLETGYGTRSLLEERHAVLTTTWLPDPTHRIALEGAYREFRLDGGTSLDGQSFGTLGRGRLYSSHVALRAAVNVFHRPTDIEAGAFRVYGSIAGALESWPFTSLASTVFQNRLNFRSEAAVAGYWLRGSTDVTSGSWYLRPAASIVRLRTNAATDHWEPEFLVFGVRNFRSDPLNMVSMWLTGISLTAEVPFGPVVITLEAEQFIPLHIDYGASSGEVTGGEPAYRTRSDGGRRVAVVLRWIQQ